MIGVPPTVMPEGSIPGNGHTIHLQLRRPNAGWTAHLSHSKLLSAINRAGSPALLGLVIALAVCSLWKDPSHLPQEPQCVSCSLDRGWALAQDQQEAEEEEEEDSQKA